MPHDGPLQRRVAKGTSAPAVEVEASGLCQVVDCPFCGSAGAQPVTGMICDGPSHHVPEPYRSMSFRMVRCADCGFVYQREQLRREHLARFYDQQGYFCYKSFAERGFIIRRLAEFSARRLIAQIERLRPRTTDLFVDFGCGNGSWLELFRHCRVPWELHGTEIDAGNVEHVRKLGFRGHLCDDRNIEDSFAPGSVGMIYVHHVIEHVENPLEMLRRFRRVLAPGGIVVGQTPDVNCLERRLFGDHWCQWHLPHHLALFDKKTMAAHAARAGFEVALLKSSPSGATQWAASFLKWRAARRGRPYRWSDEPLHPLLTLMAAPLAVAQGLVHNTSHLDFVLRKPVD
jgi:SAM-dependent methyltransferase